MTYQPKAGDQIQAQPMGRCFCGVMLHVAFEPRLCVTHPMPMCPIFENTELGAFLQALRQYQESLGIRDPGN